MTHRFGELTPLQALQAAIAIERRNTALYENLAKTFASYDSKLGEVFAAMAEEETGTPPGTRSLSSATISGRARD